MTASALFALPALIALLAAADPSPAPEAAVSTAPAPQVAQPAPAPPAASPSIESILGAQQANQTTDEEDEPAKTAPFGIAAPPAPGTAPPTPSSPQPGPSTPTPYSDIDSKAYGDAILAAARTAQALQGPLDGDWTLAGADGRQIYRFRFANRGLGLTPAEGAWRDLEGRGPGGSGFVASVAYDGDELMLRFNEAGPDDEVVVQVKPTHERRWPGRLWRHGVAVKVTLNRE